MAPRKKRHEYTLQQRTQILLLKGQGLSMSKIAAQLGLTRTGVWDCWNRMRERQTVENKHRSGRPKENIESAIGHAKVDLKLGRIASAKEILDSVRQDSGVPVSLSTVKRRMKDEGYRAFRKVWKPKVSRAQRRTRLTRAREWLRHGESFWRTVVFTDETQISRVSTGDASYVYLPKNLPFTELRMKPTASHGGGCVNLWLAICPDGILAYCFFQGGLDAASYVKIVKTKLMSKVSKYFGEDEWLLQADGDPAHTAKRTVEELEELGESRGFSLLAWPPHSPDLNPVENVFAQLKDMVSKAPIPRNTAELQELVASKIEVLNAEENRFYFQHLYDSMPRRCFQVIEARGLPTKY
jgi:transposase